jgi:hypothetical protein
MQLELQYEGMVQQKFHVSCANSHSSHQAFIRAARCPLVRWCGVDTRRFAVFRNKHVCINAYKG